MSDRTWKTFSEQVEEAHREGLLLLEAERRERLREIDDSPEQRDWESDDEETP